MTDPIADMLTRIRNANQMRYTEVEVPTSNIILNLKYDNKTRVITGLKRISKPGLRVYAKASEMPQVLNGLGIAIVSTSKGVMTGKQAKAQSLGGEVLAYVW